MTFSMPSAIGVTVPNATISGAHIFRPPSKSTARTRPASRGARPAAARSDRRRRSQEDRLGQERRHDPVGRVHDLADLEIDGHRADDVGLLAAEAALLARCGRSCSGSPAGRRRRGRGRWRWWRYHGPGARPPPAGRRCAELRLGAAAGRGCRPKRSVTLRAHLDRGDAHLAVALGAVGVAHAEQRAVHQHRQVERGAGGELADVHVAAAAPGRHRAVAAGLVEGHAHHAGERLDGHRHRACPCARGCRRRDPRCSGTAWRSRLSGSRPRPGPDRRPAEVERRPHVERSRSTSVSPGARAAHARPGR